MKLGAAQSQGARRPGGWSTSKSPSTAPRFTYRLNRKKLRAGAPPRRPLSAAHQPHRDRSGQALEVLPAAGRSRGGVQDAQGRSGDPADLPSGRARASRRTSSSPSSPTACTSRSASDCKRLAPGLTPRSVLEKFAAVQMIDVHVPTTDGRELRLTRYTQPEPELKLLLEQTQAHAARRSRRRKSPPPRPPAPPPCSADLVEVAP